jgi:hypothetical protein
MIEDSQIARNNLIMQYRAGRNIDTIPMVGDYNHSPA